LEDCAQPIRKILLFKKELLMSLKRTFHLWTKQKIDVFLIVWKFLHQKQRPKLVADSDILKCILLEELQRAGLNPAGQRDLIELSDLVTNVVARVEHRIGKSSSPLGQGHRVEGSCKIAAGSLPHFRLLSFCQTCSLISLWELQFRLLGNLLGLKTRIDISAKSKKNHNLAALEFVGLEDLINQFKHSLPQINLDLKNLQSIRNTFVHGNFQAARKVVNASIRKSSWRKHDGNLLILNYEIDKLTNPTEAKTNKEIEEIDDFSWNIDALTPELSDSIFSLFEDSIQKIDTIALLKSVSSVPDNEIFSIITTRIEPPNEVELDRFQSRLKKYKNIFPDRIDSLIQDALKLRKK